MSVELAWLLMQLALNRPVFQKNHFIHFHIGHVHVVGPM